MNPAFDRAAFRFEDPFGPSADPARYVPRDASELALSQLQERVVSERHSALLAGIPGIGKTLLLRILRARFGPESSVVHLRYPALPAAALFAWALHELDGPNSYDPVGALVALAAQRANQGGDIVLLVDDAETLPDESAQALYAACEQSEGALRFLAAGDRESLGRLAGHVHDSAPILFVQPMKPEETSAYIAAHLAAQGLSEAAAGVFDASALAELQASTEGIPARVNAEASRRLRRALGPSFAAPAAKGSRRAETTLAAPTPEAAAAQPPPLANAGQPAALTPPLAPEAAAAPNVPTSDQEPLTPTSRPQRAPQESELETAAALERAAGRLALAQQGQAPDAPLDPEAERAAGRLALANVAVDEAEARFENELRESEASAALGTAEAGLPAHAATPLEPDAAPSSKSEGRATLPKQRRQPPLSIAAGIFLGCLAAGALFGVRLLESPRTSAPLTAPEPKAAMPEAATQQPTPEESPALPPVSAAPSPAPIAVQINARPWAEIYVDGTVIGVTPLAGVLLAPGPHRFQVRFPNGVLETHTLEIDEANRHFAFPLRADAAGGGQ